MDNSPVLEIMNEIITQIKESEEEFIYKLINPYCETIVEKRLSKKELEKILRRGMQERKKGKWREKYIGGCMMDVCSECGQKITTGYFKFNYCPNCGAEMVEDKE